MNTQAELTPAQIAALTPQELEAHKLKENTANYKHFSKKQWKLRNKGQVEYYDTKYIPLNISY